MSEEYLAGIYDWLADALEAAMELGQPQLALTYAMQMRTMEQAGLVTVIKKGPTVH